MENESIGNESKKGCGCTILGTVIGFALGIAFLRLLMEILR